MNYCWLWRKRTKYSIAGIETVFEDEIKSPVSNGQPVDVNELSADKET